MTVGDVMTLQRGVDITRATQRDGNIPVVSSGGIASFHDTAHCQGPGVVIGRKGTLGGVFYLADDYWPHDTTLWVSDFKGNSARFVYYFLKTLDFKYLDGGSANPTLNRNHVHPLPIRWPNRSYQDSVATLLVALDDKIAANASVIAGLDSLMTLHYRNQAVICPLVPLSGLASFINGRAFTKDATGAGRVVIRIAELNSGLGPSTVRTDLDVPEHHVARPGDLLFAWSGSLTVHRWFRDEAIVNQHIFKVVPKEYPKWLVKCSLDWALATFRSIAADKTTTMGHIQRHHLDLPVPLPGVAAIERLDPLMSALWSRALTIEQESLMIAELRDTLLGPLMSGRLSIKHAERVVEGVV